MATWIGIWLALNATSYAQGTSCNSMYAAYLKDKEGLATCDTNAPGAYAAVAGVPAACNGVSPNECLDIIYDTPLAPAGPGAGPMHQAFMLESEVLGEIRCVDGTKPMFHVAQAVEYQLNGLVVEKHLIQSNKWVFGLDGEAGGCHGPVANDWSCWSQYYNDAARRSGLSTYAPDGTQPALLRAGLGIMSDAETNAFHGYNRVHISKCAEGHGTADEIIFDGGDISYPVFHHGTNIWKGTFHTLAVEGFLVNGLEIPALSLAETIVLVGHSDAAVSLMYTGDHLVHYLQEEIETGDADVFLVADGRFPGMLEYEHVEQLGGVYDSGYDENSNGENDIFDDIHYNPAAWLVPGLLGAVPYSDGNFNGDAECAHPKDVACANTVLAGGQPEVQLLDASCVSHHSGAEAKYCHDYLHTLLNHVQTPVFIKMNQRDNVVSTGPAPYADDPMAHKIGVANLQARVVGQTEQYLRLHNAYREEQLVHSTAFHVPDHGGAGSHTTLFNLDQFENQGKLRRCYCSDWDGSVCVTGFSDNGLWSTERTLVEWIEEIPGGGFGGFGALEGHMELDNVNTSAVLWLNSTVPCPP